MKGAQLFEQTERVGECSVLSEARFPPFSVRTSLVPPLFRNGNDSVSRNDKWWNLGCSGPQDKIHEFGGDCWIENKTRECRDKWGGTSTDTHHCTRISDVRLEEEVLHMVWLGRMQSEEQRSSSKGSVAGGAARVTVTSCLEAAWVTGHFQDTTLPKRGIASSEGRNLAYLKQILGK